MFMAPNRCGSEHLSIATMKGGSPVAVNIAEIA